MNAGGMETGPDPSQGVRRGHARGPIATWLQPRRVAFAEACHVLDAVAPAPEGPSGNPPHLHEGMRLGTVDSWVGPVVDMGEDRPLGAGVHDGAPLIRDSLREADQRGEGEPTRGTIQMRLPWDGTSLPDQGRG